MRRRTVLTAAALGAFGPFGVVSCSPSRGISAEATSSSKAASTASPRSYSAPPTPIPPSPESRPEDFSSEILWPAPGVSSAITAVYDHYLAGTAHVHDVLLGRDGLRPVVVDLNGPTTWAVLLDDGEFTTRAVDLAPAAESDSTITPSAADTPAEGYTAPLAGPAVIDGTHAYIVVASIDFVPGENFVPTSRRCPASLVKVSLADGTLEETVELGDSLAANSILVATEPRSPLHESRSPLYLSLTQDGTAVMVSAAGEAGEASVGLRLSTRNLAVEFDINMSSSYSLPLGVYGEAIAIPKNGDSIVALPDSQEFTLKDANPFFAWNGWLYYLAPDGPTETASLYARNLGDGETVTLDAEERLTLFSYLSRPGISSNQQQLVFSYDDAFYIFDPPSSTTTPPGWDAGRPVPRAACVFGNVLYTVPTTDSGDYDDNAPVTMELTDLVTGEGLSEISSMPSVWPIAVTAWGLACGGTFYPATSWIEN